MKIFQLFISNRAINKFLTLFETFLNQLRLKCPIVLNRTSTTDGSGQAKIPPSKKRKGKRSRTGSASS